MIRQKLISQEAPAVAANSSSSRCDLDHRGGVVAHAIGHEACHIGDEQDPDRAIDPAADRQVADHHRKAEHEPGNDERHRGEIVDEPAPGNPGPQNDPANHRAQQHDQGGRGEREENAVPDRRAHARIIDHGPIGVERDIAQRRHARHAVESLQRRPDEDEERQDESEQRIADEKGRGEIAPRPEIHHARAEPLAGDGRISLALAAEPRLPVDAARGDGEKRNGIGGGEPDIARIAVDRLIDRGGEDLDADRQAEQGRQLRRIRSPARTG